MTFTYPNSYFKCVSCDEGMYLYRATTAEIAGLSTNKLNSSSTFVYQMCVPDCPTVNFQTVNNPELGRCEFLGFYCKKGNYKDGCTETYDSKIIIIHLNMVGTIFTLYNRSEKI